MSTIPDPRGLRWLLAATYASVAVAFILIAAKLVAWYLTDSASLLGYRQKEGTTAKDGSYYFDNGSMAPARHMLYNEPGNFMWPDWFKRKDDTLTRGLRAE